MRGMMTEGFKVSMTRRRMILADFQRLGEGGGGI